MNNGFVSYLQCDPRWGKQDYSTQGEKTDVCESGCGPTCMAMVLATWVSSRITPSLTSQWSKERGYKALKRGTYYSYFEAQAKSYGLKAYQLNRQNLRKIPDSSMHEKVFDEINKGNAVIACMGKGIWTQNGHYILITSIDSKRNIVNILDPASTKLERTRGDWQRLTEEVKYYFVVEKPKYLGLGGDQMDNKDKPSEWAQKTWEIAKRNKIFDGSRPHEALTREEAAAVIVRALKIAGVDLE